MRILSSLKSRAILWVVTAMIIGMASASLWMYSLAQWNQHLHTSYVAGLGLVNIGCENVADTPFGSQNFR